MVGGNTQQGVSASRRSHVAFFVAGGLLGVDAALDGINTFTTAAYPIVENIVGPAGFLFGFLGVLGLYRRSADGTPVLARVGAGCVTLGAVAFTVITLANLGRLAGVAPAEQPAWFPVLFGLVILGMVPGFLAFGLASLRIDGQPWALGGLLLAPAILFAIKVVGANAGYTAVWLTAVILVGHPVAYLAIGTVLRTERALAVTETTAGDGAMG